MDRSVFARRAFEQVKKARPGDVSILDEERFQIITTTPDGQSSITSLSNYYDEYAHAPPEQKQGLLDLIARVARAVDGEESLDEVRVMLVPRIRPRRYFEIDAPQLLSELATRGDSELKAMSYVPLAGHLGVAVAIDRPEQIEYVTDPARFNTSGEELDAIALANLKRMPTEGLKKVAPGLWLGTWADEYAAERMLMPELFAKIDVAGDPVAFLPGAERLYVVGSEDETALRLVLDLVDARVKEPRGLLRFGFVLRGGVWRLFEPKTDIGRELGARLSMHLADAYSVQRKVLEAKYEAEADPPFVAGVLGVASKDGDLQLTVTTWGDGIHAFLPRAQVIGIGRPGGPPAMVPWEDVMELAGDCLQELPGIYPPRWETTGFPDEATLTKIMARAMDKADEAPADAPGSQPGRGSRAPLALALLAVVVMGVVYAMTR